MSFVSKRERVFKEYSEPVDLPARNEGKLKAYGSCTDTRAWSHFLSDKTEHLIEIIKKNHVTCPAKYFPVNVIVDMLMAAKNAEIARLKRKVQHFEKMMSMYDELELSCEQKCEISAAKAMIQEASKSLDEISIPAFDMDISTYTEGSEGFQTGKSRGYETLDSSRSKAIEWELEHSQQRFEESEVTRPKQNVQDRSMTHHITTRICLPDTCDKSTLCHDQRIDELREEIIGKDAKLCAINNTLQIMENDVCEPYCIYAHIFTALEKIFATLRQNAKYMLFLDTMASGKDTRCIGIKGKILFKLKILEKFSLALISPCAERFKYDDTCECYSAQVVRMEATYALTSTETKKLNDADTKRARLVADIIGTDEMKEIVSKDSIDSADLENLDNISTDSTAIENLKRLKNLQRNYDELMNCYEEVKFERDNLQVKCLKYDDLEKELDYLRNQLIEYNQLYNEREYYRKRSEDLDGLKEKYIILADETTSIENELKAETEINHIKSGTIEELRSSNVSLEKRLNDLTIDCEKEKNALECKLKEAECKIMCQEQQIRSLSAQIDNILDQDREQIDDVPKTAALLDKIESLKDVIRNLTNSLQASEEEKEQLQNQFENKLKQINDLKLEIEDWKSAYEKTLQRNEYLEKYAEGIKDQVDKLVEENKNLTQEVDERSTAVANLMGVINNRSQEVGRLMDEIESKNKENNELLQQLQNTKDSFGSSVSELEKERKKVIDLLDIAKRESLELIDKVKDYDDLCHRKEDLSKLLERQAEDYNELKNMFVCAVDENNKLKMELASQDKNNAILLSEIQRLREINNCAAESISSLQGENQHYKTSIELSKRESDLLGDKLKQYDNLQEQLEDLRACHEKLMEEKLRLESDLRCKTRDLENALQSAELTKKESQTLIEKLEKSENFKEDIISMTRDYQKMVDDQQKLQKDLADKNSELDDLLHALSQLKIENEELLQKSKKNDSLEKELKELQSACNTMSQEKSMLQADLEHKNRDMDNLIDEMNTLKANEAEAMTNVEKLQDANLEAKTTLNAVRKESEELIAKLRNYDCLLQEYDDLKRAHLHLSQDNEKLQGDLDAKLKDLIKLEQENDELNRQTQIVLQDNESLEKALIAVRNDMATASSSAPYDDIIKEIQDLKLEQQANHDKIRQLLDKLDESDNRITDLTEDIMARDDKIAILQNHINALEDEVRQLHDSLQTVVTTGEELKDNSYQKIDHALNKMEAHHSKATHNMKMELAKLQNENYQLEEQLSLTKIKSEESLRDMHKYVTQIVHLENEREMIATDIKQIEISCFGNSPLIPNQCSVEDVLKSLDRIRKCLDAKTTKSSTLENTLLKVQTSSQLLLSKADEAKKLVEKEKQKIISEKEEAIADKLRMEKQLADLKAKLEAQAMNDQGIIRDLEAEILNQKLIMDKLKTSTQDYISKLENEMQSLQDLYQTSITNVTELQDKMQNLTSENDKNKDVIDKMRGSLEEKSKEVASLQKNLKSLNNIPKADITTQVHRLADTKHSKTQTDKFQHSGAARKEVDTHDISQNKDFVDDFQSLSRDSREVEPTIDSVRTKYLDYKKQFLGPGKLEQYSISGLNLNHDGTAVADQLHDITNGELAEDYNLVDIYNRPSFTSSSKAVGNISENATTAEHDPQYAAKSSIYTDFDNIAIFDSDSNINSSKYANAYISPPALTKSQSNAAVGSSSEKSKDLFLIYQDSESSQAEKTFDDKDHWLMNRQPMIMAQAFTTKPNKDSRFAVKTPTSEGRQSYRSTLEKYQRKSSVDSGEKYQLQIDLPRVGEDGHSSEGDLDNESLDSFNLPKERKNKRKDILRTRRDILDTEDVILDPEVEISGTRREHPGKRGDILGIQNKFSGTRDVSGPQEESSGTRGISDTHREFPGARNEILSTRGDISGTRRQPPGSQNISGIQGQSLHSRNISGIRGQSPDTRDISGTRRESSSTREGPRVESLETRRETSGPRGKPSGTQGETSGPRKKPSGTRGKSSSPREESSSPRDILGTQGESSGTREKSSSPRGKSSSPREKSSSHRGKSSSPRDILGTQGETSGTRGKSSSPRGDSSSPRDISRTQGESSSPRDISGTRAESSSPRDISGTRGESSSPRDILGTRRESSRPRDISGTRGESSRSRDISGTRGESSSPRNISGTRGEPSSPRDILGTRRESSSPRDISGTRGESSSPRDLLGTRRESSRPRDISGTRGESSRPRDISGTRGESSATRGESSGKRDILSLREESSSTRDILGLREELSSTQDISDLRGEFSGTRRSTPGTQTDIQKRYKTKKKTNKDNGHSENDNTSYHKLSRVEAEFLIFRKDNEHVMERDSRDRNIKSNEAENFLMEYTSSSIKLDSTSYDIFKAPKIHRSRSDGRMDALLSPKRKRSPNKTAVEKSVMADIEMTPEYYENTIRRLSNTVQNVEKDYKRKLETIKMQYDNNIRSILNDHNQGVESMQSLHEETLQDVLKTHENEVENLRTMSLEAMRRAEKLEKENRQLKTKIKGCNCLELDEEPIKMTTYEAKKRRFRCHHGDMKMLTKTNVEAFNVRPKPKIQGPCTCSLDVNVSDTIRNIFEQVDVEHRKMAEHTYLKYIANKILSGSVEALDPQELSFLHLKVCRTWKYKLTREETLQRKIETLQSELMNKQRHSQQQHLAEVDRQVAEQRRRLQEVQDAVCRSSLETPAQTQTRGCPTLTLLQDPCTRLPATTTDHASLTTRTGVTFDLNERRSAGDLTPALVCTGKTRRNKNRPETRAVLAKLDVEEHREKKLYDEAPTRLRRDRPVRPARK